jgi:poly-gamma-glutamate capsule biosynthesis protein CapA/YwtB (metallophosphatase superfamily)
LGVNLLEKSSFQGIKNRIADEKRTNDIIIFSVHWGGNWGYEVPFEQRELAHRLIDNEGVDVVWGHSSHHVKESEVHNGKLVLYGCGDFLNDYEGIDGFEGFRGDLNLMYFAKVEADTGRLASLRMVPTQVKRFKIDRASKANAEWIKNMLNREGSKFGTAVDMNGSGALTLRWTQSEMKQN